MRAPSIEQPNREHHCPNTDGITTGSRGYKGVASTVHAERVTFVRNDVETGEAKLRRRERRPHQRSFDEAVVGLLIVGGNDNRLHDRSGSTSTTLGGILFRLRLRQVETRCPFPPDFSQEVLIAVTVEYKG
jgi:hypothetical protein